MKHLVSRQRRLRPQPPSSWPTAHDWLFQGDIHTRDENDADATPPGLISSDQMADIAGIWKKLGARARVLPAVRARQPPPGGCAHPVAARALARRAPCAVRPSPAPLLPRAHRRAAARADADGSGSLSLEELDKALKLLGYENDEDTAELVRLIDKDGSGVIEWEEFRTLMVTKVVEESNEVEVRARARGLAPREPPPAGPTRLSPHLSRAAHAHCARETRIRAHVCARATGARTPLLHSTHRCRARVCLARRQMDLTFEMLDLNGDGDISGDELKALLMHRGQALSAAEADDLVSLLSGGSGVVSYETFREGMSALFRATPSTSLENRHADTPQRKARFSRPTNANGASYNSLPGGGGPQQPPSPISESNSLPPPSPAHAAAVSGSMCHSAAASENTASFSEGAVVVDRQRSRSLEERQPELPGACGPPPAFGGVFGGIHLPGAARRASSHAEQTTESPVKSISPSEGGSTSNTPPRRESRLRPSDADDDVP